MTNATQVQTFNLADLIKNPGKLKSVTHKVPFLFDKEGKGYAGAVIVGKNSDEYQDAQVTIRVLNMQRAANRTEDIDTKTEAGAKMIIESMKEGNHMTALAVTVGLYGFDNDGKEIEFSKDIVNSLYESCPQWRQLVVNALENDANFTTL